MTRKQLLIAAIIAFALAAIGVIIIVSRPKIGASWCVICEEVGR